MKPAIGIAVIVACVGCTDHDLSRPSPQYPPGLYRDVLIPGAYQRNLDILVVMDDSPTSTLEKQASVIASFPNFINVLSTIEGGLPNLHIGVVTTDMGTTPDSPRLPGPGIGSGPGACSGNGKGGNLRTSALVNGNFIIDQETTTGRLTNYSGTLQDAFASIASVGSDGCGFEQPLHAAKRALNANPMNAGFLRYDAYLALLFVTDEDDCSFWNPTLLSTDTSTLGPLQSFRCNRFGHTCSSGGQTSDQMNQVGAKSGCASNESSMYLSPVQSYVDFFKGLKPFDSSMVIVAGIAGPTTPYAVELRAPQDGSTAIPAVAHSCAYSVAGGLEVADPPLRLKQFVNAFPNRSTFSTICQEDQSGSLVQLAELLRTVLPSSCLPFHLADVDPNTPGVQPDCAVSFITNFGKANQTETILPECNGTHANQPCWWLEYDVGCTRLRVDGIVLPPDGQFYASCLAEDEF